ncbi:unnamed protein product, partial [Polarella glacialis]
MAGHGLTASGSTGSIRPEFPPSAQPGGPWVDRNFSKKSLGLADSGRKVVAQPPQQEAARVAWLARRKATLHGQLGTGNKISSVIQFPNSTRDPDNQCSRYKNHLSAEDRRILRLRLKGHLKGKYAYPDSLYLVEKVLLTRFAACGELCNAFYCNEDFCNSLLDQAANVIVGGGYKDAPGHMKFKMTSNLWDDSFMNKTTNASVE